MSTKLPHIVIVGGGASGLELATKLGHKLGKKKHAKITLVDQHLTHVWKPMLHEVAAGTIDSNEDELSYAAHAYYHHFHFQVGRLHALDRESKIVTLFVDEKNALAISYDILVIAVGSISNNFAIPGTNEYCYYLDSRVQADQFHLDFIQRLMGPNSEKPLQIAIIGAGATGVELAAELHFSMKKAQLYGLKTQQAQITLIEGADRILPVLPERISEQVAEQLVQFGVDMMVNELVSEVTVDSVKMKSGQSLHVDMVVWCAGIKAPDILATMDGLVVTTNNQLVVNKTLQTTEDSAIFAMGDCAYFEQEDGSPVPARAQAAHQEASCVVNNIRHLLRDEPLRNYHYIDYGSLISLSHKGTIGQLMSRIANVMVEGYLARLFYLSLYKLHQLSLHGWWRTSVMTSAKMLNHRVKPKMKLH